VHRKHKKTVQKTVTSKGNPERRSPNLHSCQEPRKRDKAREIYRRTFWHGKFYHPIISGCSSGGSSHTQSSLNPLGGRQRGLFHDRNATSSCFHSNERSGRGLESDPGLRPTGGRTDHPNPLRPHVLAIAARG